MFWKSTSAFYNEIARIPLVIRPPGGTEGRVVAAPVSITDIMPTILSCCGLAVPGQIHGHDLLAVSRGAAPAEDRAVLCERFAWNKRHLRNPELDGSGSYLLRWQNWTYMVYDNGDRFLYDLDRDPAQNRDLSADRGYGATLDRLHAKLKQHLDEHGGRDKSRLL